MIEEQIKRDKEQFMRLSPALREYLLRDMQYRKQNPVEHDGFNYESWNLV